MIQSNMELSEGPMAWEGLVGTYQPSTDSSLALASQSNRHTSPNRAIYGPEEPVIITMIMMRLESLYTSKCP